MNKKAVIALLIPLLVLLPACRHDASELTVVTGIGVDGVPGAYRVGAEVIPLLEKEEDSQSVFLSIDGGTVTDSIQRMVSMTGRSLYCNHLQVLVVGRDTAGQGVTPLLEELLRGTQYPVSLRLAVSRETAAQILRAKPVVSDLRSVEMEDMIQEGARLCLAPDRNVCEFYEEIQAPGIEGVLPFLELRENEGEQVCALAGTALFQGDRAVSVLDQADTQRLMWLRGRQGGVLNAGGIRFDIIGLSRSLEADARGAVLTLKITLKSLENEENEDRLTRLAEEALAQQCQSLVERLKRLRCDAVGFGNAIYRSHRDQWEQLASSWPEIFSDYPVEVRAEVRHLIWGRIWSTEGNRGEGSRDGS